MSALFLNRVHVLPVAVRMWVESLDRLSKKTLIKLFMHSLVPMPSGVATVGALFELGFPKQRLSAL